MTPLSPRKFYREGIRFSCTRTGRCCKSRGKYRYVYLCLDDRRRLAAHFGIPTLRFTKRYAAKTGGLFHLTMTGDACLFLKRGRCSVYDARPLQCRTWPFWPENMRPRVWEREVAPNCPGVGRGRLHTAGEIEAILSEWEKADF